MATTNPPRESRRGTDVWPDPRRIVKGTGGGGPDEDPSAQRDRETLMALLVQRFLRYHVRPDDAQDFTLQGEQDRNAADTVILPNSFEVPEGMMAVIVFLQVLSTVADATSNGQSFALKINGADVPGYGGILIFQAGGAQALALDTFIPVSERQSVSVAHTGVATARRVGYLIRGYFAPKGAAEGKE